MCMQNFITIFHSVQEIAPLSVFQNLELGKASTDEKCHFPISLARYCQYQYLRKGTEASMDPPNVAIMFTWSSCFMLTCRGITRHDDMKYVNMPT